MRVWNGIESEIHESRDEMEPLFFFFWSLAVAGTVPGR